MKKIYALLLAVIMLACGCTKKTDTLTSVDNVSSSDKQETKIKDVNTQTEIPVRILQETVDVEGIEREFNIFFLADSHISLCDDRDKELLEKASSRSSMFKVDDIEAWDRFDALILNASKGENDIVILGGDIIDSAMYASIDHVSDRLKTLSIPYIYSMGNHDFEYAAEYFSPVAYQEYLPRLDDIHGSEQYQVKEYDDFIIFAADDDNSQIDAPILEAYKKEAAKGKPVVLIVHVPIEPVTGDDSLTEKCKEVWGASADNKSRVTMGVNGCYPNDTTREFLDLVLADDSPVVLVLAGHIHFYHKDMLNNKTVQIVTGAAFEGDALRVTLK